VVDLPVVEESFGLRFFFEQRFLRGFFGEVFSFSESEVISAAFRFLGCAFGLFFGFGLGFVGGCGPGFWELSECNSTKGLICTYHRSSA
jgi:hypothetical protein